MMNIDFNDLHKAHGLQVVKDCINKSITVKNDNKSSRFTPVLFSGQGGLTKQNYLVKRLLDAKSMSVMYGESGCGKTFMAIDIAMHIALGKEWHGKKVRQHSVVYIAAEAGTGIHERLTAFRIHHAITEIVPLYVIAASPSLRGSSGDVNELINEIRKLSGVGLIIIDTLSRTLAGGNENSSDDMGSYIINCGLIQEGTGAHVMIVHHSGKESSRGARGHSSLRAAVDTEMEVTQKDEVIGIEVTKQREGKTGEQFYFTLKVVEQGKDEDGDPITSCALAPCDAPTKALKLPEPAQIALDVLRGLITKNGHDYSHVGGMIVKAVFMEDFRTALKDSDISASDKEDAIKKAISRAIKALKEADVIMTSESVVWIQGHGDKGGTSAKSE